MNAMNADDVLCVLRALEALGYLYFEGTPEGEMAEEVVEHLKRHPSGIYPDAL